MFSIGTSGSGNCLEYASFAYIGGTSSADVVRTTNGLGIEGKYLDNLSGSVNSYKFDGSAFTTKVNGIPSMTSRSLAGTNMTCDSLFVGIAFYSGSFTYSYYGNLYEILVYNRALTENEVHKMHIYLSNKYNINVSSL
jgi:hypothetical protein